jgi:uncharacterized membrane protein YhhN
MITLIPLPFFLVSMAMDIYARAKNSDKLAGIFQPLTTFIVIVIALLSLFTDGARPGFTVGITVGLIVSFWADILLVDRDDSSAFIKGMLLFFIALITYSVTLILTAGFHLKDLYCVPVLIAYFIVFMKLLGKGLGKLKIPVAIYGLVFLFCISRAFSTFFSPDFTTLQAVLLTAGTSLFLLGDTQLAIYHFVNKDFPMFWAPAFYFVGQCLIALSLGFFA